MGKRKRSERHQDEATEQHSKRTRNEDGASVKTFASPQKIKHDDANQHNESAVIGGAHEGVGVKKKRKKKNVKGEQRPKADDVGSAQQDEESSQTIAGPNDTVQDDRASNTDKGSKFPNEEQTNAQRAEAKRLKKEDHREQKTQRASEKAQSVEKNIQRKYNDEQDRMQVQRKKPDEGEGAQVASKIPEALTNGLTDAQRADNKRRKKAAHRESKRQRASELKAQSNVIHQELRPGESNIKGEPKAHRKVRDAEDRGKGRKKERKKGPLQATRPTRGTEMGVANERVENFPPSATGTPRQNMQLARVDETGQEPLLAAEGSKWRVSKTTGGRMLDIDPIFSSDEDYLLVAYVTHVTVYATATSLPVRKLLPRANRRVKALSLLAAHPNQLFIGLDYDSIELWDWSAGERTAHWSVPNYRFQHLRSVQDIDGGHDVLSTTNGDDSKWQLSAHTLQPIVKERCTAFPLFTHDRPISSLNVLDHANIVIMTSEEQLILGSRSSQNDQSYTWRIVTCPEWITSIDVRSRPSESSDGVQSKTRKNRSPSFDIAVGGLKGAIHIYDDLLTKLVDREKNRSNTQDITSRRAHWHRSAVLSTKWSKDGNYLISGGQETVMIMWQLDTGKKETLPHLGAPIESIVISPTGSSYGIRLADNSAMILSTSEMRPSFSISGIQMPAFRQPKYLPKLLTADSKSEPGSKDSKLGLPACISPSKPGQILLAVPSYSSIRMQTNFKPSASYLQIFDVSSGHQISRQALARTNITNLNMGPDGQMLVEPKVTHMATSEDGKWLATVDEWMPPMSDTMPLAFDIGQAYLEQTSRREIYLKFWSWNDSSDVWELVSRVDKPHVFEGGRKAARVIGLVSDPSKNGFSTFGTDGNVKAWKPVIRHRNGLEVKDKTGSTFKNWHCRFSLTIPNFRGVQADSDAAKMAWSLDGSVIALGLQSESVLPIYLIDALDGTIEKIQTGLYSGPLLGLGILDKYLIIFSQGLNVWDLVADALQSSLTLQLPQIRLPKLSRLSHLAIDAKDRTFAATMPHPDSMDHTSSISAYLAVFDTTQTEPLFVENLSHPLSALLPAVGRRGYYAIDAAAEVKTFTPGYSFPLATKEIPKVEEKPARGLSSVFGKGALEKRNLIREAETDESDARYVTMDQLTEVLDPGPSRALPPVEEMFERVAQLFIGRTAEVKS